MPGAARYSQARAKLADCELHGIGSGAELILVEGDSAQDSVLAVRERARRQCCRCRASRSTRGPRRKTR
jgi:DNA gyrase/topoisomerase IV subunit B